MKIGFFDSGIGGLTVLKDAIDCYPNAHYIYYADSDNIPYGTKSKKEIKKHTNKAVKFLISKKVDIIVLACNTATSVAIKGLRKKYTIPIIGMEPAIKPATEINDKGKKILICATPRTLKEKKLKTLIRNLNAKDRVDMLSLQKLVSLAEEFDFSNNKSEEYIQRKLGKIEWDKYSSVVLGCTHFIYFKPQILKQIPNNIELIDGNLGTVNRMMQLLPKSRAKNDFKIRYYVSGRKAKAILFEPYLSYLSIYN